MQGHYKALSLSLVLNWWHIQLICKPKKVSELLLAQDFLKFIQSPSGIKKIIIDSFLSWLHNQSTKLHKKKIDLQLTLCFLSVLFEAEYCAVRCVFKVSLCYKHSQHCIQKLKKGAGKILESVRTFAATAKVACLETNETCESNSNHFWNIRGKIVLVNWS